MEGRACPRCIPSSRNLTQWATSTERRLAGNNTAKRLPTSEEIWLNLLTVTCRARSSEREIGLQRLPNAMAGPRCNRIETEEPSNWGCDWVLVRQNAEENHAVTRKMDETVGPREARGLIRLDHGMSDNRRGNRMIRLAGKDPKVDEVVVSLGRARLVGETRGSEAVLSWVQWRGHCGECCHSVQQTEFADK
jgi:hypothetical protein